MPSGYTSEVHDGKVTDAADYLKIIARGFGAYITLRDEPQGVPLPEEFEADTSYHDRALADAKAGLAEAERLTDEEWAARAAADYAKRMREHEERKAERDEIRQRYERMMEQVEAWVPPTSEHEGVKKLAIEQLQQSIDWDTRPPRYTVVQLTPEQLREQTIEMHQKGVEYHTKGRQDVIDTARSRTEWSRAFVQSLDTLKEKA